RVVIAQLAPDEMCRCPGKRIIAKLRIIDKGKVRPGVGQTQGEGIAPATQSQVLAQVAEQEQGTPHLHPQVPGAVDVLEAWNGKRRAREGRDIDVHNLIPQLDIVKRHLPGQTWTELAA